MHCCDASCSVLEILPFLEYNRTRWHLFCDAQSAKKYIFFFKKLSSDGCFFKCYGQVTKNKVQNCAVSWKNFFFCPLSICQLKDACGVFYLEDTIVTDFFSQASHHG